MVSVKLFAAVVVILIAVATYLLFFSAPVSSTFDDSYENLSLLWLSKGVNIKTTDFDESVLVSSFSSEDISGLKSVINEFKNSQSGNSTEAIALRRLSEIHLNLVSILEKTNELEEVSNGFEFNFLSYDALCIRSKSDFESIISLSEEIASLADENNSLIGNYNRNYLSLGASASNLLFDSALLRESIASLKQNRADFKELCEA